MAPQTNIGAAHPVSLFGDIGEEMKEKIVNDAASYITSLAEGHNRNKKWAEEAVRKSRSSNEEEALKLKVIDYIASDLDDLFNQIEGKKISLKNEEVIISLKGAVRKNLKLSFVERILQAISDPNIAIILLLLGVWGIISEFSSPGIGFPGIVGGISLILAFFALSALPINLSGLLLILLGIGFLFLEAHTPTFGLLALGGITSFVLGSFMLIRPFSFIQVSHISILGITIFFALIFFPVIYLVSKARHSKVTTGKEGLISEIGIAKTDLSPEGTVFVHGEYWKAKAKTNIPKDSKVQVKEIDGSTLVVEPILKPGI